MKEFAVYRGDKFEFMGTTKEICEEYGVKPDTVWFWNSKANKKRLEERKARGFQRGIEKRRSEGLLAIVVDYKEEEDECFI